jgi:hypothetical protein
MVVNGEGISCVWVVVSGVSGEGAEGLMGGWPSGES